jgi:acyl transferase domain-containing protein
MMRADSREATGAEIAVIGMAGRFPGAPDVAALWANLAAGVESVRAFTDDELRAAGVDDATLADPSYVRAGGWLEGADLFDAPFFGFTPREAEITDPQQRIFLECAWEAMEDAGCSPRNFAAPVGVYAGMSPSAYLIDNLLPNRGLLAGGASFDVMVGNDKDYLATRVSYKLGLRGPSLSVQTACSTSLVAIHLACRSLLGGECDLALAGGVAVHNVKPRGYPYRQEGIMAPDGHCRAFDEAARGTVGGGGAGVVVLKRLEDALADGDTIRAVILGTAINNDGSAKVGYMAPGADGQAAVIADALSVAGVDARTVSFVEAHGTGTPLGDPVEVAALTRAFRAHTDDRSFCALGSIKTNVGHLDTAAGVAGLIKTVLALENRTIPGTLHFQRANPKLEIERTPFHLAASAAEWKSDGPRRAGVSSFGLGGTNAHAVLEEAPAPEPRAGEPRPVQLLVVSARTPEALDAARERLASRLESGPEVDLADAAHTLQTGRAEMECRAAVAAASPEEATRALRAARGGPARTGRAVTFLFPGQGAQHVGMAAAAYATEPVFRAELDRCAAILAPELGFDLRDALYPPPGGEAEAEARLSSTAVTQPAVFAVEWALARTWESWGVKADAMLGHSVGEFVAATLAGVFSVEDALRLVAARGRLVQSLPGGAMLGVFLAEADLLPRLPAGVSLAAVNGDTTCVVAGPTDAVAAFERSLDDEGIETIPLHVSHAGHSAMMDPVLAPFRELVSRAGPRAPTRPYVSSLTGRWITPGEATDPGYWARLLREPVRFGDGVATLLEEEGRCFLECGPGRSLGSLIPRGGEHAVVSSLPRSDAASRDSHALADAVGRVWSAGVPIDWSAYSAGRGGRRVPLPTYPFERRRYYIEALTAPAAVAHLASEPADSVAPGHERPAMRVAYSAPSTELEQAVADVWSELLGTARVGVDDDFFELGGHSLLATRVIVRLRSDFGVELPMDSLFVAPTVAGLAVLLDDLLRADADAIRELEERLLADVEAMSEDEVLDALADPPAAESGRS